MRAALRVWLFGALLATSAVAADASDWDARALMRLNNPPLGLPASAAPADNPPSAQAIALGRKLFFDRRLSVNGTMSCGMCHVPEQGFTNNELATPVGVEGRSIRRNAPSLLNAAHQRRLFHDGRAAALETQAIMPLVARNEMANPSIGHVIARLERLADYAGLFERAFGGGPSAEQLGRALASYQRGLLLAASPFDRFQFQAERDALSPKARQGFELFAGKAGCNACHPVAERHALFTDHGYHNTGIGYRASRVAADVVVELAPGVTTRLKLAVLRIVGDAPEPDQGRYEVTQDPADLWRYKTPSLRNVALTAPYMHDGSIPSLVEVLRYYNAGGAPHDGQDLRIRPLGLSEDEIADLVEFLASLTGQGLSELIADARSVPVGNY